MKRPEKKESNYHSNGSNYGVCGEYICNDFSKGFNKCHDLDTDYIEKEISDYYTIANLAIAFVDLKPEHKLYESIRQDLKRYLDKIRLKKRIK